MNNCLLTKWKEVYGIYFDGLLNEFNKGTEENQEEFQPKFESEYSNDETQIQSFNGSINLSH
jgi:hypothetical protein